MRSDHKGAVFPPLASLLFFLFLRGTYCLGRNQTIGDVAAVGGCGGVTIFGMATLGQLGASAYTPPISPPTFNDESSVVADSAVDCHLLYCVRCAIAEVKSQPSMP